MAWLGGYVPEEQALAGYRRVDDLARARLLGADVDGQSLAVARSQVFTDLLLGALPGQTPAPISIEVLVDRDGVPHAERLGPVLPSTVHGWSSWPRGPAGARSPGCWTPWSAPVRTPSAALRTPTCRRPRSAAPCRSATSPACSPGAPGGGRCELDHTVPWPHGPTCPCNLAALCKHHHRLKHRDPGWHLVNHGNGHLTWTTPWGTTYTVTP